MNVEFYYPENNLAVKQLDYVKLDNSEFILLDLLNEDKHQLILIEMRNNPICRKTIDDLRKSGINSPLELIRLTARKHFAKLDKKPDIDTDKHLINIETK